MFEVTTVWKKLYPQSAIGILALQGVANPSTSTTLDEEKNALEHELRQRYAGFSRAELRALPSVAPYVTYYKRFKKTYHVLQQLESVALKGKSIRHTAALVEAMFMAELSNHLLTAGHDLDVVQGDVSVTVSTGRETYTGIGGRELNTKEDDMMITDESGILSSIVYGPDQRTRIMPETTRVLFTVYAPDGIHIQLLWHHLNTLRRLAAMISPEAEVVEELILSAG
jgi:DNA/RNA-binding domain of Phe-tRNA-synthetase-like protein